MTTENRIFGYARCSTNEEMQDINRQIKELIAQGVPTENIYKEYESGTKTDRIELNRLMDTVVSGDTIISTEVSRISRSTAHLCQIIEIVKEKHIRLILGTFTVDCRNEDGLDPMTEGMLKMMGVFAEMERNMISERVKSGMKNAREKGVKLGRPQKTVKNLPRGFMRDYKKMKAGDISKSALARMYGMSRPTLYRNIEIIENKKDK